MIWILVKSALGLKARVSSLNWNTLCMLSMRFESGAKSADLLMVGWLPAQFNTYCVRLPAEVRAAGSRMFFNPMIPGPWIP